MSRFRHVVVALVVGLALAACDPQVAGAPAGGLTLTATFDHVRNLVRGHAVRVADVEVGTVVGIELDGYRARVTMALEPELDVPEGTVAAIRKTSLLGENFVALEFPTGVDIATAASLPDGAEVPAGSVVPDVEQVAQRAIEVIGAVAVDDVATLVDASLEILTGREQDLNALIDDLAGVTGVYASQREDLAALLDGLGAFGADLAGGADDIGVLIDDLGDTAATVADQRDRIVTTLGEVSRLVAALDGSLLGDGAATFRATLDELGPVVAQVAEDDEALLQLITDMATFVERFQLAVVDESIGLFGLMMPAGQDLSFLDGPDAIRTLLEPVR